MMYIMMATFTLMFRVSLAEITKQEASGEILMKIYLSAIFWPVYFLYCVKRLYW
jgi:hypothetical protein